MAPRARIRKLSGLEIDEVSLVDRPANQHGLVAFAKRDEENSMDPIFDAEGNEVDPDQLEHGDVVYAEDGQELVFVEDGEPGEGLGEVDDGQYEQQEELEYEDAGVGKSLLPLSGAKGKAALRLARGQATGAGRSARNAAERAPSFLRNRGIYAGMQGRALGSAAGAYGRAAGGAASEAGSRAVRSPQFAAGVAAGGAGGAGAYAGGRRRREVGKSLGEEVRVALSKALTEDERDAVISNAMDLLGDVVAKNSQLEATVLNLIEDRELEAYGEIAKSYDGLPVDEDELGPILHRVAGVLEPGELATLDRVFKAAGASRDFEELGYGGPGAPAGANEVLEQVYALAGQAVGKAQSTITPEQAVTAIFEANPAAYDEYEAEQRGLR